MEDQKIPPKWKKYIINFKPAEFHHILAFSKLYIGSGATIAAEAAVLGVPSIYTNYEKPRFIFWLGIFSLEAKMIIVSLEDFNFSLISSKPF